MRLRASVLGLLLVGIFSAPMLASAAVPFWGPIIPDAYNVCAANWGLVIVVINNIISLGITLAIAIVAPLSFAYAGFLLLTSGGDPGKRGQARRAITNVVVGIVVALASYLIVAALMAVLYHPDDPRLAGKTWADLVVFGGTPPCIELKASLNQNAAGQPTAGVNSDGVTYPLRGGDGACDPVKLQEIAGTRLNAKEVATFACIAEFESSCGTIMQNFSWNKPNADGLASSAYGAFQILLSSNAEYFETSECYQAASTVGPLECKKGFGARGFTAGGDPNILQNCVNAAANLECNFNAAIRLYKARGSGVRGFNAWTADPNSNKQKVCIQQIYNAQ